MSMMCEHYISCLASKEHIKTRICRQHVDGHYQTCCLLDREVQLLPSMIDMCTALRRVRGTLLRRGPWVMDGQLLLGTRPALQRQTQEQTDKHDCTEKQLRVEVTHTLASRCF